MKKKPQPPEWKPRLLEYVQYRDNYHSVWLDAQVSQITAHTITVFVFKFRVAHQINKFTMKDFVRKHPKDLVLNDWKGVIGTYGAPETLGDMDSTRIEVRNTPHQSKLTQEVWNSIERNEAKVAEDEANLDLLNNLAWKALGVGIILGGLFYIAYHFRFQLDLFQLVK